MLTVDTSLKNRYSPAFPKKALNSSHKFKQETKLRSLISTARATVMKGCSGTHKTSYGLNKGKAKTQKNEIVRVFFAVMTAKAVRIGKPKATESPPKQHWERASHPFLTKTVINKIRKIVLSHDMKQSKKSESTPRQLNIEPEPIARLFLKSIIKDALHRTKFTPK